MLIPPADNVNEYNISLGKWQGNLT